LQWSWLGHRLGFVDDPPAPNSRAETRDDWLAETWQAHRQLGLGCLRPAILLIPTVGILFFFALGPIGPGNGGVHTEWTQQAHAVGLALYSYANDNDGQYPDGASSTEVMQKLIDGGYITDLAVLYIPMEGKVAPERGQKKLKPENLSFDLTAGADSKDSPSLPLLYITGYRMAFTPGAVVRPSSGKFPNFGNGYHFLFFPWDDLPDHLHMPGIAVYYNGHNTVWCEPQGDSIPNIVPLGFDAHGKTYRQLTPDGVLR